MGEHSNRNIFLGNCPAANTNFTNVVIFFRLPNMLILAQHFTFVTVFRVFVVHYTFLYYHWICSYCRDILWYCKCFSIILSTAYISLSPSLPSPSRPYVFVIAVVMITLWLTLIRVQAHTSERMSPFLSLYQFLSLSSSSLVLLSCVERLSALFFLSLSACQEMEGRLVRLQWGCVWHHHNLWLLGYEREMRSVAG